MLVKFKNFKVQPFKGGSSSFLIPILTSDILFLFISHVFFFLINKQKSKLERVMTTLIGDNIFKRFLVFLVLLLFAVLLIYTDYLQEINFYQNKLQLYEFKVNFDTFKLLKDSSNLSQEKLKLINKNLEYSKNFEKDEINEEQINNDDTKYDNQYFSLNPPFPNIDLTSIGPVFIENGLIHLYCEFSFDTIRCTVGGRIPAEKNYLPTAYFTNPNFENIGFSLNWKDLINIFYFQKHRSEENENIGWLNQEVLKANKESIELFTNYIILFGSNGTYMNMFNNKLTILNDNNNGISYDDENDDNGDSPIINRKYRYYKFIHTQVCILFLIIYLKLVNFLLFLFTIFFQFGMHIPIYFFSVFRFGKNNSMTDLEKQNEEMDMTGFEEWIRANELIEDKLFSNDLDSLNFVATKGSNDFYSNSNNLRLRKSSLESFQYAMKEGNSTGIDETYTMRLQDIRKLYYNNDEIPLFNGNNLEEQIILSSALTNDEFNSNKIENQETNDDTTLVNRSTSTHQSIIIMSSLNQVVDKYYLFYLLTCIFLLFHLIIYEGVNMVLYNMISSIFENLTISNANDLNMKNKTILRIPTIFVGSTTIYDKTSANTNIVTFGNHIFDCLLNFLGCFSNVLLAIIFHGIYIICIYVYTVSMY